MKRGYFILVAAALAVGTGAGWGVGAARRTCEHTCPPQGPCPTPVDCLSQPFNLMAATVVGIVVTAVIVAVGIAVFNRTGRD